MVIKVGSTDVQSIYVGDTVETTEAWTRPNVTSATSNGTITWGPVGSSGTEDGWHAYDSSNTSRYVPKNSDSYLQWVLPYTLRFYPTSTFVCKGRTDSDEGNDNNIYRFYADSAKTIPMTDLFSRVRKNQTKTIASTLTAPVDTNTIYLDVTGTTGWSGFTDINFTGVDKVVTTTGTIPVQEVYVGSTKVWPVSDCTLVIDKIGNGIQVSAGYINAAQWIDSSGNPQTTVTTFTHPQQSLTDLSYDADQSGFLFLCSDGTVRAEWASATSNYDRVPIVSVTVNSSGTITTWQDITSQVIPQ